MDTDEDWCHASRRLSVVYALEGEAGFQQIACISKFTNRDNNFFESGIVVDAAETVAWETMFRLFLTATTVLVPPDAAKAASFCGGLYPDKTPYIERFPKCPGAAEPGNHAYACLCRWLKDIYLKKAAMDLELDQKIPGNIQEGKDRFFSIEQDRLLGIFVKASLGASDAALAVHLFMAQHLGDWKRSYSDIVGAGCGVGDRVTPFIDRWIKTWILEGGCGCEGCVRLYGDRKILNRERHTA